MEIYDLSYTEEKVTSVNGIRIFKIKNKNYISYVHLYPRYPFGWLLATTKTIGNNTTFEYKAVTEGWESLALQVDILVNELKEWARKQD